MEHWHRSGQALLNEISSTRLPASQLAVWSIGQCGFIFKYEDTVVCIDPVLSDLTGPSGSRRCYPAPFAPEALRADLVLCTHGHADHMAKDTLRGLARHPAARFVLPAGCSALAAEYGIPADRITTVQEGSILPLGGVTVRAFSAAHPEHILDAGDPGMALGYQLTFGGFTVVPRQDHPRRGSASGGENRAAGRPAFGQHRASQRDKPDDAGPGQEKDRHPAPDGPDSGAKRPKSARDGALPRGKALCPGRAEHPDDYWRNAGD